MPQEESSCVEKAAGPIGPPGETNVAEGQRETEVTMVRATVGKEAPDFEATAFIGGAFKNVKLSDYKNRWVAVCFYPGDFTFV